MPGRIAESPRRERHAVDGGRRHAVELRDHQQVDPLVDDRDPAGRGDRERRSEEGGGLPNRAPEHDRDLEPSLHQYERGHSGGRIAESIEVTSPGGPEPLEMSTAPVAPVTAACRARNKAGKTRTRRARKVASSAARKPWKKRYSRPIRQLYDLCGIAEGPPLAASAAQRRARSRVRRQAPGRGSSPRLRDRSHHRNATVEMPVSERTPKIRSAPERSRSARTPRR